MLRKLSDNSAWLVAFFVCFSLFLALACYPFWLPADAQQTVSTLQVFYLIATQLGWLGLLAFLLVLLALPLTWLPTKWFRGGVVMLAALLLILLQVDITVFQHYKFHINGLLVRMFVDSGSEVFHISWLSWALFISEIAVLLIGLAVTVWLTGRLATRKSKYAMVAVWFALLMSSQAIHAYKNALYDNEVSQFTSNWPLYYPLTARSWIYQHGWVDEKVAARNRVELKNVTSSPLHYPLQPVALTTPEQQPNVLFILIDAWRYSDATAEIMPNVSQFAEKSAQFSQHMSGGNSTQAGMFSLFYSLPATYWDSVYASQTAPVFLDALQHSGYRMGIFGSASLTSPPLSRTVFKNVKDLRLKTPGDSQVERDARITNDFLQFVQQPNSQPYFGFLFYDSAHGTEFPEPEGAKFTPYWERVDHILLNNDFDAELYHNRYKNSLYYIDGLIDKVLKNIDLSNTIVVLTSDHGEEFNDNGMNYWGHSGNYSQAQIHVPLYIYTPDQPAARYDYRTTHFDLVPTLMERLFGEQTDTATYSVGHNLFDDSVKREWFIAGSYYNYALVGQEIMMVVNPAGNAKQLNSQLSVVREEKIPPNVIQRSLDEMSRFFAKKS
ncbi:hydrolase [Vibrio cidicii]|uniref:Hydrolase n=1 Tax=Vibrio cidicii TaxID=1763883 RepID=A0ABR5W2J7_9VIBR|nr:DUF3413 domain-containing protein [Vibrio cidicii]KYN86236.1 hydrolase [Vibrio cidicii]